jgi:hypothetical protein
VVCCDTPGIVLNNLSVFFCDCRKHLRRDVCLLVFTTLKSFSLKLSKNLLPSPFCALPCSQQRFNHCHRAVVYPPPNVTL